MTEPTVVTLADAEACSIAAAERIVEILDVAIDDRGEAHWATTGGSTPGAIYRHLALGPLRGELDWRKVQLWWTDERFVPIDHPQSNAKIAFDLLLDTEAFSGESGTGESGADVIAGRARAADARRAPPRAGHAHPAARDGGPRRDHGHPRSGEGPDPPRRPAGPARPPPTAVPARSPAGCDMDHRSSRRQPVVTRDPL